MATPQQHNNGTTTSTPSAGVFNYANLGNVGTSAPLVLQAHQKHPQIQQQYQQYGQNNQQQQYQGQNQYFQQQNPIFTQTTPLVSQRHSTMQGFIPGHTIIQQPQQSQQSQQSQQAQQPQQSQQQQQLQQQQVNQPRYQSIEAPKVQGTVVQGIPSIQNIGQNGVSTTPNQPLQNDKIQQVQTLVKSNSGQNNHTFNNTDLKMSTQHRSSNLLQGLPNNILKCNENTNSFLTNGKLTFANRSGNSNLLPPTTTTQNLQNNQSSSLNPFFASNLHVNLMGTQQYDNNIANLQTNNNRNNITQNLTHDFNNFEKNSNSNFQQTNFQPSPISYSGGVSQIQFQNQSQQQNFNIIPSSQQSFVAAATAAATAALPPHLVPFTNFNILKNVAFGHPLTQNLTPTQINGAQNQQVEQQQRLMTIGCSGSGSNDQNVGQNGVFGAQNGGQNGVVGGQNGSQKRLSVSSTSSMTPHTPTPSSKVPTLAQSLSSSSSSSVLTAQVRKASQQLVRELSDDCGLIGGEQRVLKGQNPTSTPKVIAHDPTVSPSTIGPNTLVQLNGIDMMIDGRNDIGTHNDRNEKNEFFNSLDKKNNDTDDDKKREEKCLKSDVSVIIGNDNSVGSVSNDDVNLNTDLMAEGTSSAATATAVATAAAMGQTTAMGVNTPLIQYNTTNITDIDTEKQTNSHQNFNNENEKQKTNFQNFNNENEKNLSSTNIGIGSLPNDDENPKDSHTKSGNLSTTAVVDMTQSVQNVQNIGQNTQNVQNLGQNTQNSLTMMNNQQYSPNQVHPQLQQIQNGGLNMVNPGGQKQALFPQQQIGQLGQINGQINGQMGQPTHFIGQNGEVFLYQQPQQQQQPQLLQQQQGQQAQFNGFPQPQQQQPAQFNGFQHPQQAQAQFGTFQQLVHGFTGNFEHQQQQLQQQQQLLRQLQSQQQVQFLDPGHQQQLLWLQAQQQQQQGQGQHGGQPLQFLPSPQGFPTHPSHPQGFPHHPQGFHSHHQGYIQQFAPFQHFNQQQQFPHHPQQQQGQQFFYQQQPSHFIGGVMTGPGGSIIGPFPHQQQQQFLNTVGFSGQMDPNNMNNNMNNSTDGIIDVQNATMAHPQVKLSKQSRQTKLKQDRAIPSSSTSSTSMLSSSSLISSSSTTTTTTTTTGLLTTGTVPPTRGRPPKSAAAIPNPSTIAYLNATSSITTTMPGLTTKKTKAGPKKGPTTYGNIILPDVFSLPLAKPNNFSPDPLLTNTMSDHSGNMMVMIDQTSSSSSGNGGGMGGGVGSNSTNSSQYPVNTVNPGLGSLSLVPGQPSAPYTPTELDDIKHIIQYMFEVAPFSDKQDLPQDSIKHHHTPDTKYLIIPHLPTISSIFPQCTIEQHRYCALYHLKILKQQLDNYLTNLRSRKPHTTSNDPLLTIKPLDLETTDPNNDMDSLHVLFDQSMKSLFCRQIIALHHYLQFSWHSIDLEIESLLPKRPQEAVSGFQLWLLGQNDQCEDENDQNNGENGQNNGQNNGLFHENDDNNGIIGTSDSESTDYNTKSTKMGSSSRSQTPITTTTMSNGKRRGVSGSSTGGGSMMTSSTSSASSAVSSTLPSSSSSPNQTLLSGLASSSSSTPHSHNQNSLILTPTIMNSRCLLTNFSGDIPALCPLEHTARYGILDVKLVDYLIFRVTTNIMQDNLLRTNLNCRWLGRISRCNPHGLSPNECTDISGLTPISHKLRIVHYLLSRFYRKCFNDSITAKIQNWGTERIGRRSDDGLFTELYNEFGDDPEQIVTTNGYENIISDPYIPLKQLEKHFKIVSPGNTIPSSSVSGSSSFNGSGSHSVAGSNFDADSVSSTSSSSSSHMLHQPFQQYSQQKEQLQRKLMNQFQQQENSNLISNLSNNDQNPSVSSSLSSLPPSVLSSSSLPLGSQTIMTESPMFTMYSPQQQLNFRFSLSQVASCLFINITTAYIAKRLSMPFPYVCLAFLKRNASHVKILTRTGFIDFLGLESFLLVHGNRIDYSLDEEIPQDVIQQGGNTSNPSQEEAGEGDASEEGQSEGNNKANQTGNELLVRIKGKAERIEDV